MLMALKTNGGVIQIVGFASYLKANPLERGAAITALQREFGVASTAVRATPAQTRARPSCPVETPGQPIAPAPTTPVNLAGLTAERRPEYDRRMAEIDSRWPAASRATVKDFVDHIDYAVKLIGVDHVGISSDFDGGGGIVGWNSAAETFNVTLELVRRGYTEEQIGKIWSGNLLRVWGEVENVAKQIQGR
jgi:membrane dipeptidase